MKSHHEILLYNSVNQKKMCEQINYSSSHSQNIIDQSPANCSICEMTDLVRKKHRRIAVREVAREVFYRQNFWSQPTREKFAIDAIKVSTLTSANDRRSVWCFCEILSSYLSNLIVYHSSMRELRTAKRISSVLHALSPRNSAEKFIE